MTEGHILTRNVKFTNIREKVEIFKAVYYKSTNDKDTDCRLRNNKAIAPNTTTLNTHHTSDTARFAEPRCVLKVCVLQNDKRENIAMSR